jgi:hypothetical protein
MRATVTAVLDTESGELQTILMGGESARRPKKRRLRGEPLEAEQGRR